MGRPCAWWILGNGPVQVVKVAQWVIEEEKKHPHRCLVGFLKSASGGGNQGGGLAATCLV